MPRVTFDHCVIHVSDWQRSGTFYREVLGAEIVPRGTGFACRFGAFQLNCHGPGLSGAPLARLPVAPGNSDLCFEWHGSLASARAHLDAQGVAIEAGPVRRFGAKGAGESLYFRDPDGSLLEFICYPD